MLVLSIDAAAIIRVVTATGVNVVAGVIAMLAELSTKSWCRVH